MRVLFSSLASSKGGGATVAGNIEAELPELAKRSGLELGLLRRKSDRDVSDQNDAQLVVREVDTHRAIAELQAARFVREFAPDWVITTFGPAPLLSPGSVRTVSSCAYSNLFYPEVDFWKDVSPRKKLVKSMIDYVRLTSTLRSDIVLLESPELAARAQHQCDQSSTEFIHMPPARDLQLERQLAELPPAKSDSETFTIGLFSGWHPNKNWELLPEVARKLCCLGVTQVEFHLTADESDGCVNQIIDRAQTLGVSHMLHLIGKIGFRERAQFLASCDAIMLLSNLESFSNNVYEAWASGSTLIISNRDWAKSVVGDAAVLVELNPDGIATSIELLVSDPTRQRKLRCAGLDRLRSMPSHMERLERLLEVLGDRSS